ncbi:MAG TPA: hypothetical protein VEB21_17060 [Terriglobales bacterium]|nr:hypothetical protein [Terriglobales bacterium]
MQVSAAAVRLLFLLILPALALVDAGAAFAALPARLAPEEAVSRAVNRWSAGGDRIDLHHPHHQVRFDRTGITVAPRSQQTSWTWQLEHIGSASVRLPRVDHGATVPIREETTVRYRRGAVIEEYVARAGAVEQRFVIKEPLGLDGEDLVIRGHAVTDGRLEETQQGWIWRGRGEAVIRLGQVSVFDSSGKRLPATMSVSPVAASDSTYRTSIVIEGAALASAQYPVLVDPEIGANDFQISSMGELVFADLYFSDEPAVAYNSTDNEYLVIWIGSDDSGLLEVDEFEVFGQRIDAATGAEVGADDFRISHVGPDGDLDYFAASPAVSYNPIDNEYLVVWQGNDNDFLELEIFGQLLDADGTEIGDDFVISDVGISGQPRSAFSAAVAHDHGRNHYLVVFSADDSVDNEFEIYGQRLDAAGAELGDDDFRISDMGVDGSTASAAFAPAVAYNHNAAEFLVVWYGDDPTVPFVDNEFEIFGQRLNAVDGAALGSNDFRISDMGPDGSTAYRASEPAVVHNTADNQYLVVWGGTDNTPPQVLNEEEIFGQRLDASGAEIGSNDFVLSSMGPDGSTAYSGLSPELAYDADRNEYLIVWYGDDDTPPLSQGDLEVFARVLEGDSNTFAGDQFVVSDMDDFAALPRVAYASTSRQYLAVWSGSEDGSDQEIYGQRIGNCGGGTLEPGEQCEAPFDDCCDPATCTFKAPTEVCRDAIGPCDAVETCGGTSAECPADVLEVGTVCQPAASVCDIAETCDGSTVDCPEDQVGDAGILCRGTAGECDEEEVCDGVNPLCPSDLFSDDSTVCRPIDGVCDVAEVCTGSGPDCPDDSFAASGLCRGVAGVCDVPESCDGNGRDCPEDAFAGAEVVCRSADSSGCDVSESCSGGAHCPEDGSAPDMTQCSDSDVCTTNEVCLAGVCTPSQIAGCGEAFVGYKGKAPEADGTGAPLANALPENFIVTGDDVHIDGAGDDPENFRLGAPSGVLLTAAFDGSEPASTVAYVRYRAKGGPQSAAAADSEGVFPKAAKHVGRLWDVSTALGSIELLSKRVTNVLVPAAVAISPAAPGSADSTHFLCYSVKVTKAATDQAPGGKFAKNLQAFFATELFDDCALDQSDAVPFASTAVESHCLFDAKKVAELCNPANFAAAEPPRLTSAAIAPVSAATEGSLLCYKPKLAAAFSDAGAAALAGASVGQSLAAKQSKHVPHDIKRNQPLATNPASQFPAPVLVETKSTDRICIPATVQGVELARP